LRDPNRKIPFYGLLEDEMSINELGVKLPDLPQNKLEWIEAARPLVAGKPRHFDLFPFYIEFYEDNHPNIMCVNGRQTFKTTTCSDILGNAITAWDNVEAGYVADNEAHLGAFSLQRFRKQTMIQNSKLRQFMPGKGRANIGSTVLLNDSIAYLMTDENEYNKVEGKSLSVLMLDEAQYQDVQFLSKAFYTLSQTHGRFYCFGIGGEAGSPYNEMWERTDQREWIYEDPLWRDRLEFDNLGNVINEPDELKSILAGRWTPRKPENTQYRGYHMPQEMFATIPLTIRDAVEKYKVQPELSIEWQRINNPKSIYLSHCKGEFFKAERRPITPEMVKNCMNPYRYMKLLTVEEIREIKALFGNEVRILMGVDFGSGASAGSLTVISIIIHWRKSKRYQLAYISRRPQENQIDQSRYIADVFRSANCDFGVGDLGYGQIQVKLIQDGGRDSNDNKFNGLGSSHFVGCRSTGDLHKESSEFRETTDEHGTEISRVNISKTAAIQKFIDLLEWQVSHPNFPEDKTFNRPKLMIPYENDYDVDFLIKDLCATTRKDLEQDSDLVVEDPRQQAKKEFNHPADSMMSLIYCFTADENFDEGAYSISRTSRA